MPFKLMFSQDCNLLNMFSPSLYTENFKYYTKNSFPLTMDPKHNESQKTHRGTVRSSLHTLQLYIRAM